MIRDATPDDIDSVLAVALATELFDEDEAAEIRAMLESHFAAGDDSEHHWLVVDNNEVGATEIIAAAYHAPERMTSGTSNLLMLVVHPDHQGVGHGRRLIEHVESELRLSGCRMMIVETLGIDEFEPQRQFYLGSGFEEEARIRDFYDAGLDKVVFRKLL